MFDLMFLMTLFFVAMMILLVYIFDRIMYKAYKETNSGKPFTVFKFSD